MAIPKLEENVQIISQLPNYPGGEGGLSAEEFKKKFDEAPQIIKDFLNNILIPEMNSTIDVEALLNRVIDKTLTLPDKAAEAEATGKALKNKFDKAGGDINGIVNMKGNEIQQVGYPSAGSSAVNRTYLENVVAKTHTTASVILPVSGWSASAPYTQTVSVTGLLATDNPHVFPVYSDALTTAEIQAESWAMVNTATTGSGSLTFKCFGDKPTAGLTLIVEVNR